MFTKFEKFSSKVLCGNGVDCVGAGGAEQSRGGGNHLSRAGEGTDLVHTKTGDTSPPPTLIQLSRFRLHE